MAFLVVPVKSIPLGKILKWSKIMFQLDHFQMCAFEYPQREGNVPFLIIPLIGP